MPSASSSISCTSGSSNEGSLTESLSTKAPISLRLSQKEYEEMGPLNPIYSTYVFLPSHNVFVHPLLINHDLPLNFSNKIVEQYL